MTAITLETYSVRFKPMKNFSFDSTPSLLINNDSKYLCTL